MNKTFRRERQQIQILEHHCANYDEFFLQGIAIMNGTSWVVQRLPERQSATI